MKCDICEWRENEDGQWRTDCEHVFEFVAAGPEENMFKFCPYCGGGLFFESFAADEAEATADEE